MKQETIAKKILAMLDDGKRRKAVIVLTVLLLVTLAGHCVANNWESPLALIPRTFTAVLLGYLLLYTQSIWRYPRIKKYFDMEALKRDAQQCPPPLPRAPRTGHSEGED